MANISIATGDPQSDGAWRLGFPSRYHAARPPRITVTRRPPQSIPSATEAKHFPRLARNVCHLHLHAGWAQSSRTRSLLQNRNSGQIQRQNRPNVFDGGGGGDARVAGRKTKKIIQKHRVCSSTLEIQAVTGRLRPACFGTFPPHCLASLTTFVVLKRDGTPTRRPPTGRPRSVSCTHRGSINLVRPVDRLVRCCDHGLVGQ